MTPRLRKVLGRDSKPHAMTLQRKSGPGIGRRRDVTGSMSATELQYIRARARRTTRESQHREWILLLPSGGIAERVLG